MTTEPGTAGRNGPAEQATERQTTDHEAALTSADAVPELDMQPDDLEWFRIGLRNRMILGHTPDWDVRETLERFEAAIRAYQRARDADDIIDLEDRVIGCTREAAAQLSRLIRSGGAS